MRTGFGVMLIALWALAGPALAGDRQVVVVELYTSQGCSSCPPADALLTELTKREDVLPLAMHVDYWDYIGWADSFARPEHTQRQKAYARMAGSRSIYTPQMIIGGVDHVVGFKPMDVAEYLQMSRDRLGAVEIAAQGHGDGFFLRVDPGEGATLPDRIVVQLVRFKESETVTIRRGENAGKSITYSNIVTDLVAVAEWNGRDMLELDVALEGDGPAAIILQARGPGAIVGALRLR